MGEDEGSNPLNSVHEVKPFFRMREVKDAITINIFIYFVYL